MSVFTSEKKFGFGLMRLPLLDENDKGSIDIEHTKKMVDAFIENGLTIGYTIYFSKSAPVTIYHGKDGANGTDGKDGVNGKDGLNGLAGKDGREV